VQTAQDHSSPLEAAVAYAGLGYAVLPLAPGKKLPYSALAPHGLGVKVFTSNPIVTGYCPWCGTPWPEDSERYDLGEGRMFCPRCGYEAEVAAEEGVEDA
jgi:hypothetical protein